MAVMTRLLSQQELARLHIRLEVPLHIGSLLEQGEALVDDEIFCLESQIAQMAPLDALITLGCCLNVLGHFMGHDRALASTLNIQADFILDDYAPHWLKAKKSRKAITLPRDWNNYMAEDFEAVAELLSLSLDAVGATNAAFRDICGILLNHALSYAAHVYEEPEDELATPSNVSLFLKPQKSNILLFRR
jgi:hypothetical protein